MYILGDENRFNTPHQGTDLIELRSRVYLGFFGWGKSGRVVNCGPWLVLVLSADNGLTGDRILTIVPICSLSSPLAIVTHDECDRRTRL